MNDYNGLPDDDEFAEVPQDKYVFFDERHREIENVCEKFVGVNAKPQGACSKEEYFPPDRDRDHVKSEIRAAYPDALSFEFSQGYWVQYRSHKEKRVEAQSPEEARQSVECRPDCHEVTRCIKEDTNRYRVVFLSEEYNEFWEGGSEEKIKELFEKDKQGASLLRIDTPQIQSRFLKEPVEYRNVRHAQGFVCMANGDHQIPEAEPFNDKPRLCIPIETEAKDAGEQLAEWIQEYNLEALAIIGPHATRVAAHLENAFFVLGKKLTDAGLIAKFNETPSDRRIHSQMGKRLKTYIAHQLYQYTELEEWEIDNEIDAICDNYLTAAFDQIANGETIKAVVKPFWTPNQKNTENMQTYAAALAAAELYRKDTVKFAMFSAVVHKILLNRQKHLLRLYQTVDEESLETTTQVDWLTAIDKAQDYYATDENFHPFDNAANLFNRFKRKVRDELIEIWRKRQVRVPDLQKLLRELKQADNKWPAAQEQLQHQLRNAERRISQVNRSISQHRQTAGFTIHWENDRIKEAIDSATSYDMAEEELARVIAYPSKARVISLDAFREKFVEAKLIEVEKDVDVGQQQSTDFESALGAPIDEIVREEKPRSRDIQIEAVWNTSVCLVQHYPHDKERQLFSWLILGGVAKDQQCIADRQQHLPWLVQQRMHEVLIELNFQMRYLKQDLRNTLIENGLASKLADLCAQWVDKELARDSINRLRNEPQKYLFCGGETTFDWLRNVGDSSSVNLRSWEQHNVEGWQRQDSEGNEDTEFFGSQGRFFACVKKLRDTEQRQKITCQLSETVQIGDEQAYTREEIAAFTRVLCELVGDPDSDDALARWREHFAAFANRRQELCSD